MGFGRDVRAAIFHRVTEFSAREVNHFGSPSLITRITNDVQQVQMLVVMTCTMVVAAPMTVVFGVFMAMRQDLGLSWLLGVSLPLLVVVLGIMVSRMVPQYQAHAGPAGQHEQCAARPDRRACAWCARSCANLSEKQRFHRVNDELTQHIAQRRAPAWRSCSPP